MAKKPETLFKEKIRPQLDALKNSWWVKTQMVCIRGIPDLLGCVNGYFIALELKSGEKEARLAPLQGYILRKITKAGGLALEVTPEDWDDVYEVLKILASGKARGRCQIKPALKRLDS
jgi:hypothetical protein